MATQFRQGDVMLERVSELPDDTKPIKRESGKIVLAHGEATGHAHTIKNRTAKFFADTSSKRFLVLSKQSILEHQEHDAITLEPGVYEVKRQREYSPEAIRNVQD